MEKIAYFSGETVIYWNSIVLTLAAAVALLFFLSFYLGRNGRVWAGFLALPTALILSLYAARFVHWYCRADSYSGFLSAMNLQNPGGFALIGCFLGCFLAALLWGGLSHTGGEMRDAFALAGAAGIALGRLAAFYTAADRGIVVEGVSSLPLVYPVANAVSGALEYRFATFLFQSVFSLLLFVFLLLFYCRRNGKRGDTCLLFLLWYCAGQVVLDSTRYDSLFFRSNGFVSVVQVFSALGLLLVMLLFSRRMLRGFGLRFWCIPIWLGQAAAIGGAGFMEYYVQRHGNEVVFAYSIMSACLLLAVGLSLVCYRLARSRGE